jgi:hypothetical protein
MWDMQTYKLTEVLQMLEISMAIYPEIKKAAFPHKRRKVEFTEEDVEKLRKELNKRENKKIIAKKENKDNQLMIELEIPGENEYYAKLLKNGTNWSVGVFSSTNLMEDIRKFKAKKLELKVIEEKEALKIYKELYKDMR